MDEVKKFEYEKAYESMRFFLEYRLKAFGFFTVINGLLITAVSNTSNFWEKAALSAFAIVTGVTIHLFGIRIMNLAKKYRLIAIDTAKEIQAFNLLKLHKESAEDRGVTLDNLFKWVDRLVISAWGLYLLVLLCQ